MSFFLLLSMKTPSASIAFGNKLMNDGHVAAIYSGNIITFIQK